VVRRKEVLSVIDFSENVEVLLALLPALVHWLRLYTKMIRGETYAFATPVTRCTSASKQKVDLVLIPRRLRPQIADDATCELHLEIWLRGRGVRKSRSIDLDVTAAVGPLRCESAAFSSAHRSSDSRSCRTHVSIGHASDRLFETIYADAFDRYDGGRHEAERGETSNAEAR